jgi:hypothetical protein
LLASLLALTAPAGVAASPRIAGNVLNVNTEKRQLTINDAGQKRTIDLAEDAVIRHGSTDRTLADLHRGDRVVVTLDDSPAPRGKIVSIAGPKVAEANPAHRPEHHRPGMPGSGSGALPGSVPGGLVPGANPLGLPGPQP